MCDFILFQLWAQSCILNAISIEIECQVLPSCNFTVYVKVPWQHSGKLNLKLNFKPLHVTIIFQATISRKGKQKTDCAYTIVQNRFLMSNGTVFSFFFPLKSYFKSLLNTFTCLMKPPWWFFLNYSICFNTAYTNSVHIHTNGHINACIHAHNIHAKRINGIFWLDATPCKYVKREQCSWLGSLTKNAAVVCTIHVAHVRRDDM